MVKIGAAEGPTRLIGWAPIYKVPQTRWTSRLTVQITTYVLFIAISMATGALMPWLLEVFHGWRIGAGNSLYKMYTEGQGYLYDNNNTYAFCPKHTRGSYDPLQRGYPAPPLAPTNGRLYDAWYHKKVVLKGVSWFGFNNEQGMVDGLWAGGSSAATDFQAVVYQLKLLGFNTIRLPFTFSMLKKPGLNQVQTCTSSTKSSWAQRATDPDIQPQPEYAGVPEPLVYLDVPVTSRHLCNTYLPTNNTASIGRLMWTIQYLVANGFYVVLDYHPDPADTLALDVEDFARAWTYTWAAVACLPNFASDIRGRLLLDLLNEPDKAGPAGVGWTRSGAFPGLEELYLTTMDTIESITPNDALFMVQGSVLSKSIDGGSRHNKLGLSAGDGFLVDTTTISKYDLTDPTGFFNEVLNRPYRTRILLAPHLYGPSVSGVPAAEAAEIAAKLNSSWGIFSTDGYCNGNECIRFPVVAGEMGSLLQNKDDLSYYDSIAQYTQMNTAEDGSESPLVGWIWWAYNANSAGTGGLTTDDWQELLWPKIRYLTDHYGLKPWYTDPAAFIKNIEAEKADALTARAAADAAARSAAAAANPLPVNLTDLSVVRFGAAATKTAAADNPGAGRLDVPAVVEYVPIEGSAATVAESPSVIPAAAQVIKLAPQAPPVLPPVQPISAAATVADSPPATPAAPSVYGLATKAAPVQPTSVATTVAGPTPATPDAPTVHGLAIKAAPATPPVQPSLAAATAPTPSPATLAAPPVIGPAPQAAPAPQPKQPVSAGVTVADPSPATLVTPPVVGLARIGAPITPLTQPISAATTVPTAPATAPTVVQQATSSAAPAATSDNAAAPVPPAQPSLVPEAPAEEVPETPDPADTPGDRMAAIAAESFASLETEPDADVASPAQPASSAAAAQQQIQGAVERARSLLAETQLPVIPNMEEPGQVGFHRLDAVPAAEKATAAEHQSSRRKTAARLLGQSWNGARL